MYNPDGTPVFLYDYFSKAQNGDQSDRELYNDYLGNIVHPISQSLQYLTEDGKLSNNATAQNINFYDYYGIEENVGYQFLWHSGTVLPAWVTNLYGDEITIGGENYTVYDIDNPNVREMWEQIFEMLIPQIWAIFLPMNPTGLQMLLPPSMSPESASTPLPSLRPGLLKPMEKWRH